MYKISKIFCLLLSITFCINSYGIDYYFSPKGAGDKNGSNFANAMHGRYLSSTLLRAQAGDVFHLMVGEYHPTRDQNGGEYDMSDFVFLVKDGVTIKGGYDTNGEYMGETKNSAEKTILDGRTVQQLYMEDEDYDEYEWEYWQPMRWMRWFSDNSLSVVKVAKDAKNVNLINLTIKQYTKEWDISVRIGSGIFVDKGAELSLSYVKVIGGRADLRSVNRGNGGGLYSQGKSVRMRNSTFEGNEAQANGGAIYIAEGEFSAEQSLIYNNNAQNGGGIYSLANTSIFLVNSTISTNSASSTGGGLFVNNGIVLIGSTIAYNSANVAAGFYKNGTSFHVINSIIADEVLGSDFSIVMNSIINHDLYYSLYNIKQNVFNKNRDILPIADNGGPTLTHALGNLSSNWAIGVANLSTMDPGIRFDQRGVARNPEKSWLGAYEDKIGVEAVNDYVSMVKGETKKVKVLINDKTQSCPALSGFDTIPNSGLKHGYLTINLIDSSFTYTPLNNFSGVDSVEYYIQCGTDKSTAKVYFLVNAPLALEYYACPGSGVTLGFSDNNSNVVYNWYNAENVLVNTGFQYSIEKDDTSVQTWWVEPVWRNQIFSRLPVNLYLAATCGDREAQDCALDGTILFREDFGGNKPEDPTIKPEGIAQVIGYQYNPIPVGKGKYAISKSSWRRTDIYADYWYVIESDHTHPNDPNKGYMLQVDASPSAGQFYEHTLDNLCAGTKLYFSTWIASVSTRANSPHKVNMTFLLEDQNSNVIAQYCTGNIPDADPTWKQYGFLFTVPENTSSLKLRIINNGTGSGNGNDFVMDDVEVRFCTPPVSISPRKDTLVCLNTEFKFEANYTDDGTFGDELAYKWEYKAMEGDNWSTWKEGHGTSPLNLDTTINSIQKSNQGYYRLSIGNPGAFEFSNCRATSKEIFLEVREFVTARDIRVQACPNVGSINLSSYLYENDYNDQWNINWEKASQNGLADISDKQKGTIDWQNVNRTQVYRYQIGNECNTSRASLYISPVRETFLKDRTVRICKDITNMLNLNEIFGLESRGSVDAQNNKVNAHILKPNNIFQGSYILDIAGIWNDDSIPSINSEGDKKVVLQHKTGDCLNNKVILLDIVIYST